MFTGTGLLAVRRGLAALAVLAAASLPAWAEDSVYVLDQGHSRIGFSISHFVVSSTQGQFTQFDGRLHFAPQAPEQGAVVIHIAPASISTGNSLRDDHLRAADFFDVAAFPAASFSSTGLTPGGGQTGKLAGMMTLHGVTRPLILEVTLRTADRTASRLEFSASGVLKRSDFGMTSFPGVIGDSVTLTIDAAFDRTP